MISSTANFGTAIASDDRNFTSRLSVNGTELDGALDKWTITKGSCGGSQFSVGAVMSSVLNATFKNLTDNVKDQDIKVEIGLMVGGAYEYITLGYFTCTEAKTTQYITEITAYGHSVSKTGDILSMSTTQTLSNIRTALSSATGVNVSLPVGVDGTRVIDKSLAGLTTYQVLQILASVVGGYATDKADGSIAILRYGTVSSLSVGTDRMISLPDVEEADFTITGVSVTAGDSEFTSGTVNLEITNEYMTQDLFDNEFKNAIIGYSYRPATIDLSKGDPRLEGDDVLTVTDINGNTYTVPCHTVSHMYDGGLASKIASIRATMQNNLEGTSAPITTALKEQEKQIVEVEKIASNTNQYFWFNGTGTDTGAHITEVPQDEFTDPSDPNYHSGGNLLARSNGIAVRNGLDELATFGANGATVGKTDNTHIEMDYHSFQMVDKDGNTYAYISDLRGTDGTATVTDTFIANGINDWYDLSVYGTQILEVKFNGVATTAYTTFGIGSEIHAIITNSVLAEGTEVAIKYKSESDELKAYTFGARRSGSDVGYDSFASGTNVVASGKHSHAENGGTEATGNYSHAEGASAKASGWASHAEGQRTKASGDYAHAEGTDSTASNTNTHAEGYDTKASGEKSHAEGDSSEASGYVSHAEGYHTKATAPYSHAEGDYTKATGGKSHAEGNLTEANNAQTHAEGLGTKASSANQHVQGKYNWEDVSGNYADIVGGGTADNDRKNISALGWDGNLHLKGDVYVGCNDDSTGGSKLIKGRMFYGTCDTGASTATKVVTLASANGWELVAGTMVAIKFSVSNTASSVKLDVNGTGAKSIYYNGSVYTGSTNWVTGIANGVIVYVYDGTNWVWISHGADNNTTYSGMTDAEYQAGTGTTNRLITPARLKDAIEYWASYKAGDTLTNFRFYTASYLTTASTAIAVTVPLAKYIKATGFTTSSAQLVTRQNEKYTHGSASNSYVDWTVTSVVIQEGVMKLWLTRSTTTNAINNSPIGIDMLLSGTFT